MKTNKLLIAFALLIGVSLFTSSCKKECPTPEPTTRELLTDHIWKGIKGTEYVNGTQTDQEDMSDIEFLFAVNNELFIYDTGELSEHYTWELLSGDPEKIRITSINNPAPTINSKLDAANLFSIFHALSYSKKSTQTSYDLIIIELTADKFKFKIEDTNSNGDQVKYVYEFKK